MPELPQQAESLVERELVSLMGRSRRGTSPLAKHIENYAARVLKELYQAGISGPVAAAEELERTGNPFYDGRPDSEEQKERGKQETDARKDRGAYKFFVRDKRRRARWRRGLL